MRRFLLRVFFLLSVCSVGLSGLTATCMAAQGRTGDVNQQVRELQERVMNDQELIALVLALSADPDMQQIVNDPAVLGAISSGNYDALAKDPRIMRLLENDRVKEIQRRLGQ